jgi:hypothetical protein
VLRELDDAAVLFAADETAAGEGWGTPLTAHRPVPLRNCAWEPARCRSTLWHAPQQRLASVVMGPGFRQDDSGMCGPAERT